MASSVDKPPTEDEKESRLADTDNEPPIPPTEPDRDGSNLPSGFEVDAEHKVFSRKNEFPAELSNTPSVSSAVLSTTNTPSSQASSFAPGAYRVGGTLAFHPSESQRSTTVATETVSTATSPHDEGGSFHTHATAISTEEIEHQVRARIIQEVPEAEELSNRHVSFAENLSECAGASDEKPYDGKKSLFPASGGKWLLLSFLIVVAILAIVLGLVFGLSPAPPLEPPNTVSEPPVGNSNASSLKAFLINASLDAGRGLSASFQSYQLNAFDHILNFNLASMRLDGHMVELFALLCFWYGLDGNRGVWTPDTANWGSSPNYCQWTGIGCNEGFVAEMRLSGKHLMRLSPPMRGPNIHIPIEIGMLSSHLSVIDLSSNFLEGLLPFTLEYLTKLEYLNISNNALNSTFVVAKYGNDGLDLLSVLLSVRYFDMSNNLLFSSIPTTIGAMQNLLVFSVHDNRFTSSIPFELVTLKSLEVAQFHGNNFTGSIDSICELFFNGSLTHLTVDCAEVPCSCCTC